MGDHAAEVSRSERFRFGANWENFLSLLNDARIQEAKASLQHMLKTESLNGKTFLDVGSGSGLFSLAARMLGAKVHSFDFDPQSVACTSKLKERFFADDNNWHIESGSILDRDYLMHLGRFDIVYSWGVLHHTGRMWEALENVVSLVNPGGQLFIAIYNKQPFLSRYWALVKKTYNRSPSPVRYALNAGYFVFFASALFVGDVFRRRNPFLRYSGVRHRGMHVYHDVVDWIGGWPFEVAFPDEIFRFYSQRDFTLSAMTTCGGKHGCNQFVFKRN